MTEENTRNNTHAGKIKKTIATEKETPEEKEAKREKGMIEKEKTTPIDHPPVKKAVEIDPGVVKIKEMKKNHGKRPR